MTYDEAANAVRNGLVVTDGKNQGIAKRIIVICGSDYIVTDAKCKGSTFSVKNASLI